MVVFCVLVVSATVLPSYCMAWFRRSLVVGQADSREGDVLSHRRGPQRFTCLVSVASYVLHVALY